MPTSGFGLALAAADGQLWIGAPFAGPVGRESGGVQRYERDRGAWQRRETLLPRPATVRGEFGVALAAARGADGSTRAIVGEPSSDHPCPAGTPGCGAGRAVVLEIRSPCGAPRRR